MSDEGTNEMHLPDLSISNFRGIGRLVLGRLGRVTLLGGRNGVGKTTVLEAVRVHAARGGTDVLHELLDKREEFSPLADEDENSIISPDYAALFLGITSNSDEIDWQPLYQSGVKSRLDLKFLFPAQQGIPQGNAQNR